MHLWPSMRIRDSFKIQYLKKLEWNLHRMNSDKKQSQDSSSNQDKLLDDHNNNNNSDQVVVEEAKPTSFLTKACFFCREFTLLITCCYCCFCCGACVDQVEDQ